MNPNTSLEPARSTLPEAFRRAPTLMAGDAAGSQGLVRVWSPDTCLAAQIAARHRKTALFSAATMAVVVAANTTFAWAPSAGVFPPLYWFSTVLFPFSLTASIINVRRYARWSKQASESPIYLSTDEAGLAVTTPRGARSLRWNEITNAQVLYRGDAQAVWLQTTESILVILSMLPRGSREAFLGLLVEKTGLRRGQFHKGGCFSFSTTDLTRDGLPPPRRRRSLRERYDEQFLR